MSKYILTSIDDFLNQFNITLNAHLPDANDPSTPDIISIDAGWHSDPLDTIEYCKKAVTINGTDYFYIWQELKI